MGNYYSDDDSLQRSQGTIDGPAFQRPQAPPYQRPWYAGTDSRDERTGVEMAQARQRQADQAGVSPNDPVQRLFRFGAVGSSGAGPQGVPSPRDMPKALAAESQGRFGGQDMSRLQNLDTGFGAFMTGREGAMPDSSGGGFVRGNTAYNVNDTSQAGIQRVTARGTSPLYTNIKPEDAVAGLNNQMIGQPADEARLGLDRYQRANDIRGQMIANRDKDIPAGGYGPSILGDPNEALNAERTQRWRQDELMQSAKNNPALRGIIQQLIQSNSARDINANNVAGRANEIGLQGRNQLAAYGLQGQNQLANTMLGESLRGRNQQDMEDRRFGRESALQDARLGAEAPYRNAQAGYYGAQTRKLEEDSAYGKSEAAMFQKSVDMYMKNGASAQEARQAAAMDLAAAYKAAKLKTEGKATGGIVGYADGGAVQPMSAAEKLLADMDAKYGKTAGSAPAPAPQPAPTPPPVQQPQGLADRFRGYFGSPDVRMKQNGLAFGGAVPAQDVPGGRAVAQAVAGRQVFGQSDGSGQDDALPAVIDGERPAALTSGEFVWPVNAVKYFGMAKLNKMLAEAEKGMAPQDEPA